MISRRDEWTITYDDRGEIDSCVCAGGTIDQHLKRLMERGLVIVSWVEA
jgi:hypothetical protein